MTGIGKIAVLFSGLIVTSALLCIPSAQAADGGCSQWDMGGEWNIMQSNTHSSFVQLEQKGINLHGTASWQSFLDDDDRDNGVAVGTLDGDSFELTVYWASDSIGLYTGKVGPQGLIVGSGYDKTNPQSKADWHSDRVAKCLSYAAAPVAEPGPVIPPKALGRVQRPAGVPNPNEGKSFCELAEAARARNSPTAPDLEARCQISKGPPKALGRVHTTEISLTPAPPMTMCESAASARAANRPTAAALEERCAAQLAAQPPKPAPPVLDQAWRNENAARGKQLASQNALATELRTAVPRGASRNGFDYGMAVAEHDTANGPGKQAIQDALSADEQPGYRLAVQFSVDRNANADLAAKGAAIMRADPGVAAVRDSLAAVNAKQAKAADQAVFYKLGFDIASALFGDPALGAAGNTLMGPGSLKIRNSLTAGSEQSGFDEAANFHLARNYSH